MTSMFSWLLCNPKVTQNRIIFVKFGDSWLFSKHFKAVFVRRWLLFAAIFTIEVAWSKNLYCERNTFYTNAGNFKVRDWKVSGLTRKTILKNKILFFNIIPLNTLGPMFLQHFDSISEVTFFKLSKIVVNKFDRLFVRSKFSSGQECF